VNTVGQTGHVKKTRRWDRQRLTVTPSVNVAAIMFYSPSIV
jgi:hypothetical protein